MKKFNIFENFIFLCIILVIIQTLLDDISVLQMWPVHYRSYLIISGFIFDLIFSIEFITRSVSSAGNKRFINYFWYKRGWVDLLSSLPLLLLNSGPALYILISGDTGQMAMGIGVLNILKVIKAIRVTRVLRLVRIVKIFGKIHNTDSPMAQHHTATITTMAVFSVILTLLIFSFVSGPLDTAAENRRDNILVTIDSIEEMHSKSNISREESIRLHFSKLSYILYVAVNNKPVVDLDSENFKKSYTYTDYSEINYKNYTVYMSLRDFNSKNSLAQIQYFCIIIVIVLAFTFLYTRHFAQNVTDILHILNLGLRKKDYNLQIKINPYYKDHEAYRLAQFYNDAYLPAKLKRTAKEKNQSLSMKDLLKFNG
jgi:hypothetical protein